MIWETSHFESVLTDFLLTQSLVDECDIEITRDHVVAHSALAALSHHFPDLASQQTRDLLERSCIIRKIENSRWMTQRRIAIAKWARMFA
jgi:hypothetical protein